MARVTIADIAARLGVSKASVSYALNGQAGVSEATRQKVVAMAAELGWHPSFSARALSRSRADAIGMVLRRDPALLGTEPYYMRLLEGVEDVLSDAGQSLLLRMVGTTPGRDIAVYERWAGEGRVDGVIVLDRAIDDPRPALLAKLGLPFVLHGVLPGNESGAERIEDQHRDAQLLVEHLFELGHRRIAHITGPLALAHEVDRRNAVRQECAVRDIAVEFAEADYTFDTAYARVTELLGSGIRFTALIFSNDVMAVAGLRALADAGARDIAAVSWDDSMLCQFSYPTVTALERYPDRAGRRSATMLLELLDGRSWNTAAPSPSTLVVRETSRAAASP
ncbi:LacI family DNA-binding transcriptional regulator [Gryllotalpicola protaetiae]|uniref:LacI family transcriptional regulator n=1 Tax=Gryllotalpicola protaetiae TaxID=2419771 RepID=A0A387BJN6_9MICO|nr:LacI family DNA-binding transcriptional regulator [Gryllotalpicola protaetiae]AYG04315.1 LacI family transcriptional regulator [Gryllotalpicola protaetiae]